MDDKFIKRLHKKARKGRRGWPMATIAWYGPDAARATKAVVGIVPAWTAPATVTRDWHVTTGDIRHDSAVAEQMLAFIAEHGALSVGIAPKLLGCPHQQGIDYQGDWCPDPACSYWHGRDRWTGELVHNGDGDVE